MAGSPGLIAACAFAMTAAESARRVHSIGRCTVQAGEVSA